MNAPHDPPRLKRLAITAGEPTAGGYDTVLKLAAQPWAFDMVGLCDQRLLAKQAQDTHTPVKITAYNNASAPHLRAPYHIRVVDMPCRVPRLTGNIEPRNSFQVLASLARAMDGCVMGEFAALVTCPMDTQTIQAAGEPYVNMNTYLAELFATDTLVVDVKHGIRTIQAYNEAKRTYQPQPITPAKLETTLNIVKRSGQMPDLRVIFEPDHFADKTRDNIKALLAHADITPIYPHLSAATTGISIQHLLLNLDGRQSVHTKPDIQQTVGLEMPHIHVPKPMSTEVTSHLQHLIGAA